MTKYITVPGTWGFDGEDTDEWWHPDSPFVAMMSSNDCTQVLIDGEPFVWSTDVNGSNFLRWFGVKDKYRDWLSAAKALKVYLHSLPFADRNVIAHSHGGQVVLLAAADGTTIRNLITIGTPVRADLDKRYLQGSMNIRYWTHVHSTEFDMWQTLGSVFDGHWGPVREMKYADENIILKDIGHADLLRNPKEFNFWPERLLANLKDNH